ncbi:MAG TPA: nuclear transport factor 2 family protein, partial [Lacipirellulaceae bacterium]|nr:nuclear transport factor 2 family protein [Lacipirellulaceae bacterium]
MKCVRLLGMLAALCSAAPVSLAADDGGTDADRQAVRSAAAEYRSALRRGDRAKLHELWTATGDYVDANGTAVPVHEMIDQLTPTEASADDQADAEPGSLRVVAADVAIEDGAAGYGVSVEGCELVGRYTAIWVKRDGAWRLDSVREAAAVAPPGRPQLQPLQ